MKVFLAFLKKEFTEQLRTGKLTILGIVFVLLGVMNPATAKLTPWLLEMMSESLNESGMSVTVTSVTAMDSWIQFFKNMPIALIAFVLSESNLFTKEYTSGTLVLSLTKGAGRFCVVLSKAVLLTALWSLCFWASFGITYVYNAYYWDNSVAQNLLFSVFCQWLFGMLVVSLTVLCSVIATSNTGVLLGTGGAVLLSYLIGIIPKVNTYLPTFLCDGNSLIMGANSPDEYLAAVLITSLLALLCFLSSIPVFNKKQL